MNHAGTPLDLFVYGTLRFGDVRWKFLEPFVMDHGEADHADGTLFDTGAGYPAALFNAPDHPASVIVGHRYRLRPSQLSTALQTLDEVESAVTGLYQRIVITTRSGRRPLDRAQ